MVQALPPFPEVDGDRAITSRLHELQKRVMEIEVDETHRGLESISAWTTRNPSTSTRYSSDLSMSRTTAATWSSPFTRDVLAITDASLSRSSPGPPSNACERAIEKVVDRSTYHNSTPSTRLCQLEVGMVDIRCSRHRYAW